MWKAEKWFAHGLWINGSYCSHYSAFSFPSYMVSAAKFLQSCLTLCHPIDGSPPGSPIPGILQARTLEWVAIFFSNAGKWKVKVKSLSRAQLLATSWTAAYQAPLSMGFSRVPKNWCFWTVALEKTHESPLDCKEIQPVCPKRNQSWIFIGKTVVEAAIPILWPSDATNWLIGKDSWEALGLKGDPTSQS